MGHDNHNDSAKPTRGSNPTAVTYAAGDRRGIDVFGADRFGVITKQAIRRGTFGSLKQLIPTIERYIENWNTDCEHFVWIATSDDVLAKVSFIESEVLKDRPRSSLTRNECADFCDI